MILVEVPVSGSMCIVVACDSNHLTWHIFKLDLSDRMSGIISFVIIDRLFIDPGAIQMDV